VGIRTCKQIRKIDILLIFLFLVKEQLNASLWDTLNAHIKDESLFRRTWYVVHAIWNPPGEGQLGSWCLGCPRGIIPATGSLGSIAAAAPSGDQLCQI